MAWEGANLVCTAQLATAISASLFRVQCFPSHDFMLLSPGFELSMEMTDNV